MIVNKLLWDSDFFGLKVYKIETNDKNKIRKFLVTKNEPTLIYVFTDTLISQHLLKERNGLLVDTKVILKKNITKRTSKAGTNIIEYKQKLPSQDLYRLALQSGNFSRFKLDKRLPKGKFEELYFLWIEKSCYETSTKVFIAKDKDRIIGFITISINGKYGKIGLIAVDSTIQGKGLGSSLINIVEEYLLSNDIGTIEVPTQFENNNAVRFYKKNGFKISKKKFIYHFINN